MVGKDLIIKRARLSFVQNMFVPKAFRGDATKPKKYELKFLVSKTDPQVATIKEEILRLAKEEWKEHAEQIIRQLKAENRICLYDGDVKNYEGYEGHYYISASRKESEGSPLYLRANPGTKDKPNLATAAEMYSGSYANVKISFWTQVSQEWGKRINCNLLAAQFCGHGEAFAGSGTASADEFGNEDKEPAVVGSGSAFDAFS